MYKEFVDISVAVATPKVRNELFSSLLLYMRV